MVHHHKRQPCGLRPKKNDAIALGVSGPPKHSKGTKHIKGKVKSLC